LKFVISVDMDPIAFQYPINPQHREHTGIRPSVEMLCLNLR